MSRQLAASGIETWISGLRLPAVRLCGYRLTRAVDPVAAAFLGIIECCIGTLDRIGDLVAGCRQRAHAKTGR